jgi:hypothetical protein
MAVSCECTRRSRSHRCPGDPAESPAKSESCRLADCRDSIFWCPSARDALTLIAPMVSGMRVVALPLGWTGGGASTDVAARLARGQDVEVGHALG